MGNTKQKTEKFTVIAHISTNESGEGVYEETVFDNFKKATGKTWEYENRAFVVSNIRGVVFKNWMD